MLFRTEYHRLLLLIDGEPKQEVLAGMMRDIVTELQEYGPKVGSVGVATCCLELALNHVCTKDASLTFECTDCLDANCGQGLPFFTHSKLAVHRPWPGGDPARTGCR